jgi:hypothetical protein
MDIERIAIIAFSASALLLPPRVTAQQSQNSQPSQSSKQDSMAGMDMGDMKRDATANPDAAKSAHEAMSGHDMAMSAHMFMTELRPENPNDEQRAAQILATLRPAIEKYKDYRVALADGFQIFMPKVEQEHYHFTNYRYAFEAQFVFNPAQPTSLLYKKTTNGYELEGAMYTAPKKASEEELNKRVPLSVTRWHRHVNLCLPPGGARAQNANWKQFGLRGSITTQDACEEAGGRWIPQIFGWMVHVYPFETDPEKIWAH